MQGCPSGAEAGPLFETPHVLGGRGWRLGGSSEEVRLVDKIWGRELGRAGQAGQAVPCGSLAGARMPGMLKWFLVWEAWGCRRASHLPPWRSDGRRTSVSVRGRGRAFTCWRN